MSNKSDEQAKVEDHITKLYDLHEFKGKGAYGIVWKATDRITKQSVALKKVFDAFQNNTDAQRTFREVIFLQQLTEHDNIVKLLKVLPADNQKDLYMVFEYMETDLHKVVRAGLLNPLHMQYIIYQLLKCLKYIHSGELIHRDLKPSNLLIDSDCKVKVADFGLARSIAQSENQDETPVMTEYVATRWYRAPEILLGSHYYSKAVDMWSVGCILGEMFLGKAIFSGASTLNQIEKVIELIGRPKSDELELINAPLAQQVLDSINMQKRKSFAGFFPNAPSDFIDFIRQCLDWNPNKRMTVEQALSHPLMKDFANTEEEKVVKGIIKVPFNDNKKLSIKDYRDKIHNGGSQQSQQLQPKLKMDVPKQYQYQSQPTTIQNYLQNYESKNQIPQQTIKTVEDTNYDPKYEPTKHIDPRQYVEPKKPQSSIKTEPSKIDNVSVDKKAYSTSKLDASPQPKKVPQPMNATTYSQLLQQKYLQASKKTPVPTFGKQYHQSENKSPEQKKKIEIGMGHPVTKSYSFHNNENIDKRPISNQKQMPQQVRVDHNISANAIRTQYNGTSQSFHQPKEKPIIRDQSLVQQAMRSKSFEKSPIPVGPVSPFQRQKTQVDTRPKFTAQSSNNVPSSITQVQKLLQKCSQLSNNITHKKTSSFIDPNRPSQYQTVNYNYFDIRNSKFM